MAWHVDKAYAVAGREAQHAFWGQVVSTRFGQDLDFQGMSRIDPATGDTIPMQRGDLDALHNWDFEDGELRWRARPADAPPCPLGCESAIIGECLDRSNRINSPDFRKCLLPRLRSPPRLPNWNVSSARGDPSGGDVRHEPAWTSRTGPRPHTSLTSWSYSARPSAVQEK